MDKSRDSTRAMAFCGHQLCTKFGEPLRMDKYTAYKSKIKFARVCVEVIADFKYQSSISVDLGSGLDAVKADYKWKPDSCANYVTFGHTNKSRRAAASSPLGTSSGRSIVFNKRKQAWLAKQIR